MKTIKEDLLPMNEALCDELYVQQLEERLETDPLMVGGLLDLLSTKSSVNADLRCFDTSCGAEFHCDWV